ncbi:MAG: hypothetical protein NTY83_03205, partial [Candidatus Micrarchaeota archaeon]|nr:hypothetical protein [Candidatus Micrarchaeota archaeon]
YLLFVMFVAFFIPGMIFSLGLLKRKDLPLFEKAGIGLGIGIVVPALISFLLFLVGVNFSYEIALASVGLFYLIAIALFAKEKAWEQLVLPKDPKLVLASLALALLMILSFWIRLQTYSPIFMELDPYYYMYATHLVIEHGGAPLNDGTAWYPMEVSHRTVPLKVYPEAIGYELYTHGGAVEKYLLSDLAGSFPPVLAALAIFFFALFISAEYKREFGIIAAAVFSLIPMYLMKTMAGESEIQPYAFFALAFFFAMYALAIKRKDRLFAGLASLAFLACMLGSSSYIVIYAALIIFIPLQALFLFLMKEDGKEFLILNGIVAAGPVLANILQGTYASGALSAGGLFGGAMLGLLGVLAFAVALQLIREKITDSETATYALGGLLLAGLAVIAFTPVGTAITSLASNSLGIAKFTLPLHKTIAEQGIAGAEFQGTLGFAGMVFDGALALIFAIPSAVVNALIGIAVWFLNAAFGVGITYSEKSNSMLLVVFFLAILALVHSFYRKLTFKELRLPLLFLALIFPISIVGMLKTKYTIYLGFAVAAALGVVFGEAFDVAGLATKKMQEEEREKTLKYAFMGLVILGAVFAYFQFTAVGGLGKSLLVTSFQERFQDDPLGAQARLRAVCAQFDPMGVSQDPICLASRDPLGFANLGINYQYDANVCAYSLLNNPSSVGTDEAISVQYRCMMRLDDYWVDVMEWMNRNTPEDARFTSWWDYGHWTNYFAQRNTVLRNEHASHDMIVEVASGFLYGTPEDLKSFMLAHDSKYVFFDQEIIGQIRSDGKMTFGGKYGALNYLSCARNNETNVDRNPGESLCEYEHLWEQVYVPSGTQAQQCVVSSLSGKTGAVGFTMKWTPGASGTGQLSPAATYCVAPVTLADESNTTGTYYLDQKYENGDLKLNKAMLSYEGADANGVQVFTSIYTHDKVWVENGELKDGWEDRKGKFYDSNIYNAFVLRSLPGFDLVYETPNGEVKMYKIRE